jgi:hypothetical protein
MFRSASGCSMRFTRLSKVERRKVKRSVRAHTYCVDNDLHWVLWPTGRDDELWRTVSLELKAVLDA